MTWLSRAGTCGTIADTMSASPLWRTFVACSTPCPPGLARLLKELGGLGSAVKASAPRGLHCTLRFLGDTPPDTAERLARTMRARIVRRTRARRTGPRLDLRRTIHRNISHGGTPIELVHRRRKERPLRLVVLLDASGSMSLYTAFFVRFLHGVVDCFR